MKDFYLSSGGRRLVEEGPFTVRSRNPGVPDLTVEDGFVLVRVIGDGGIFPMKLDELTLLQFGFIEARWADAIDGLFLHLPGRSRELVQSRALYHDLAAGR